MLSSLIDLYYASSLATALPVPEFLQEELLGKSIIGHSDDVTSDQPIMIRTLSEPAGSGLKDLGVWDLVLTFHVEKYTATGSLRSQTLCMSLPKEALASATLLFTYVCFLSEHIDRYVNLL